MILSDLPVGAEVVDFGTRYNSEPIVWRVLEHGHSGDPSGSTALEARDIISLKCFDAKEPSNSDSNRKSYGNNRYLYSNLLQWLNSDSVNWYTAQHSVDQAPNSSNVWASNNVPINPYDTEAGFLTNFSDRLKAALQTVSKTTVKNTVTDGGGSETVQSKLFLLSTTEVGLANENSIAEGAIYAYYNQNNTNDRRKKNLVNDAAKGNYASASNSWYWRLRTPYASYSSEVRLVNTDGSLNDASAYYGYFGISPAMCVPSDTVVTQKDGVYYIFNEPLPSITKVYAKDPNGKSKLIQDNTTKLVSWANGTDEEIAAMLDAYYNDEISLAEIQEVWNVGDARLIHLNDMTAPSGDSGTWAAQDIVVTIIDFDHTPLAEAINGHSNACITVQFRELISKTAGTVGTIYVNGNSSYDTSFTKWSNLYMRTYINNTILGAITYSKDNSGTALGSSTSFKNMIKQSSHYRHTTYNGSASELVTDTLFLPSYPEIFGDNSYSYYAFTSPAEGTQFSYYTTTANRIKYSNNNGTPDATARAWWEGSASSRYSSSNGYWWCCVNSSGSATATHGSSAYGLAPAFAM